MERNAVFKFTRQHNINFVILMFILITGCVFSPRVIPITPLPISKAAHTIPYSVTVEFDEVKDRYGKPLPYARLDTGNLRHSLKEFLEMRGTFQKVYLNSGNNVSDFTIKAHLDLLSHDKLTQVEYTATVNVQLFDQSGENIGVYQHSNNTIVYPPKIVTPFSRASESSWRWQELWVNPINKIINALYENICEQIEQDYAQNKISASLVSLGLVSFGKIADAGETSHYKNHGVSFSYDNRLKIEESKEEKTITITLEGYEDLLLMVQVMAIPFLSGEDYAESLVKGMRDGMASSGAEATKVQKTSKEIAQKKRKGYTFDYTLSGVTFRYTAYGYNSSGKKIAVPIQYPVKKEEKVQPLIETVIKSLKCED